MLAYVFWHRPVADVPAEDYEDAMRAFHATLEGVPSATFRVDELPFAAGGIDGGGYEDWYLVDDWAALGRLNVTAVDAAHRRSHDAAASRAAEGWGGVYALVRGGPAAPPDGTVRWVRAPRRDAPLVWQRQMVLGPAPEFCVVGGEAGASRRRL